MGEKWAGEIENLALSIYKTAHSFAVSNFERHHFPAMSQGIDKKIHFPELELMLLSSPLLADLTVVVQMERGIIIADTKIEIGGFFSFPMCIVILLMRRHSP